MTTKKANKWYMRPKKFSGALSIEDHSVKVRFTAAIDLSGALVVNLIALPHDRKVAFIIDRYYDQKRKFADFTLEGRARDGAVFHSEAVEVRRLNTFFSDTAPSTIRPALICRQAKIIMPVGHAGAPSVKCLLKGFENTHPLHSVTPLGEIEMAGASSLTDTDKMSGRIELRAIEMPPDLGAWRAEVDELFKRVRFVMSFAASAMLLPVLTEFLHGDRLEISVTLQPRYAGGGMRPFSSLDQRQIFACAVRSPLNPTFEVKNLHFAIEWFAMNNLYRESKLIAAMTVLENLVNSNLRKKDGALRQESQFKRLREKLSAVVKEEAAEWSDDPDEQANAVKEFNEKFAELNRRSLKQKIDLLAKRWGVSLDGIDDDAIAEAKRARDHVVHRGIYTPKPDSSSELMNHVRVTRELVVRFILTALQFEGKYYSFLEDVSKRVLRAVNFAANLLTFPFVTTGMRRWASRLSMTSYGN